MAKNVTSVHDSRGHTPDWLELFNPLATNFNLAGMNLRTDAGNNWTFPAGSMIAANGYLIVWCDTSRPASTNFEPEVNAGFALNASGATVSLTTSNSQVADSIAFGFQVADLSIGRNGAGWSLLANPTPGALNSAPCALSDPLNLRINEWMAAPTSGNNWFELYNPGFLPANLSGLFLTDDPSISGVTNFQVLALSFIAPHGWVVFQADSQPGQGPDHVGFNLDKLGETLRLYNSDGTLIDAVDFGIQFTGVSQGRFPDGASTIVSFPSTSTPGAANRLPPVPLSAIMSSGGALQLAWPSSPYAFTLYSTTNLAGGNWQPVAVSPTLSNNLLLLTIFPTNRQQFYRLGL